MPAKVGCGVRFWWSDSGCMFLLVFRSFRAFGGVYNCSLSSEPGLDSNRCVFIVGWSVFAFGG